MSTVEQLCQEYLSLCAGSKKPSKKEKAALENKIATLLLNDPRTTKLLRSVLYQNRMSDLTQEDLLQDVVSTFILNVLPKLREPDKVFGALIQITKNCTLRLSQSRFDSELNTVSIPIGDLKKREEQDDDELVSMMAMYNNSQTNDVQLPTDEQDLLGLIMHRNATDAIRTILADKKSASATQTHWLPISPSALVDPAKNIDIEAIRNQTAGDISPRPAARYQATIKHEDDDNRRWLDSTVFGQTRLTPKILGELLGMPHMTLYAYQTGRVKIPAHALEHIERWFAVYGVKIVLWQNDMDKLPMAAIVDRWKDMLGLKKNITLAEVLEVTTATVSRWNKEKEINPDQPSPQRPSPSRLFEVELKVNKVLYEQSKMEWIAEQEKQKTPLSHLIRDWMRRSDSESPEALSDFFGSRLLPVDVAVGWSEGTYRKRFAQTEDNLFEMEHFVRTYEEVKQARDVKLRVIGQDGEVKLSM